MRLVISLFIGQAGGAGWEIHSQRRRILPLRMRLKLITTVRDADVLCQAFMYEFSVLDLQHVRACSCVLLSRAASAYSGPVCHRPLSTVSSLMVDALLRCISPVEMYPPSANSAEEPSPVDRAGEYYRGMSRAVEAVADKWVCLALVTYAHRLTHRIVSWVVWWSKIMATPEARWSDHRGAVKRMNPSAAAASLHRPTFASYLEDTARDRMTWTARDNDSDSGAVNPLSRS